jgi:hypothetical protein
MREFKEKYLRKLKVKAKQIREEHAETIEIYNLAKAEFISHILTYCKKHEIPSPLTRTTEDRESPNAEEEEAFSEKEVKDVYKKIAISTHPDKLIRLKGEDKEEKTALFKKAAEAKGSKNLNELAEIASELKIDLRGLTYTQLEVLEQQIQKIEQKIEEMHQDIAWKWYYLNLDQRDKIIIAICRKEDTRV